MADFNRFMLKGIKVHTFERYSKIFKIEILGT